MSNVRCGSSLNGLRFGQSKHMTVDLILLTGTLLSGWWEAFFIMPALVILVFSGIVPAPGISCPAGHGNAEDCSRQS